MPVMTSQMPTARIRAISVSPRGGADYDQPGDHTDDADHDPQRVITLVVGPDRLADEQAAEQHEVDSGDQRQGQRVMSGHTITAIPASADTVPATTGPHHGTTSLRFVTWCSGPGRSEVLQRRPRLGLLAPSGRRRGPEVHPGLAADLKASAGAHFVESSRMREPSG